MDALNGGLLVRDGFFCPPGAQGFTSAEVVTVGFDGGLETTRLCRIDVR